MFKSLPFFIENNLPFLESSFKFVDNELMNHDLQKISDKDLKIFHEENQFIYNELLDKFPENERIIKVKKYYLVYKFSEIIPEKQIKTLLNTYE